MFHKIMMDTREEIRKYRRIVVNSISKGSWGYASFQCEVSAQGFFNVTKLTPEDTIDSYLFSLLVQVSTEIQLLGAVLKKNYKEEDGLKEEASDTLAVNKRKDVIDKSLKEIEEEMKRLINERIIELQKI
jgi:hypothetical protein